MNDRLKHAPKTKTSNNELQKAFFHSHFHSFGLILDQWKVADIKSQKKLERGRTGNGKQLKAT